MRKFLSNFSPYCIPMILAAILINIAFGQLMIVFNLPFYLDTIGTVVVGVLIGPWAGGVVGFLTSMVWSVTDLYPQAMAWAGVAAMVGILADFFASIRWFEHFGKTAAAGLITGVISALLSAPIAAYVFGGVTGTGADRIVNIFLNEGLNMIGANLAQAAVSDPLDKLVVFLIAGVILKLLPESFNKRWGNRGQP